MVLQKVGETTTEIQVNGITQLTKTQSNDTTYDVERQVNLSDKQSGTVNPAEYSSETRLFNIDKPLYDVYIEVSNISDFDTSYYLGLEVAYSASNNIYFIAFDEQMLENEQPVTYNIGDLKGVDEVIDDFPSLHASTGYADSIEIYYEYYETKTVTYDVTEV